MLPEMMQSFRALIKRRSFLGALRSGECVGARPFGSDADHEVLVEGKSHARTAILNRPANLNSLTTSTGAKLQKLYQSWEGDPAIGFVMMKGSGRVFCAGGDIVTLFHLLSKGGPSEWHYHGWWWWSFNPWNVPRCYGQNWEYLALTGETLSGAEMFACGLAAHYSLSTRLPQIEEHLGNLVTDDPSVIEASLGNLAELVAPDNMSIIRRMETVDRCFSHETVAEIIDALENEAAKTDHTWCTSTLKRLREVSPLSLKVSLRSIREGRYQTLDQCLVREYRMSLQGISGKISSDFREGVRARMVGRDFSPKWDPPNLDKVSADMVDQYFSRLSPSEPDLELPVKQREAFA